MTRTKNKRLKLFLLSCLMIFLISMKSHSVFAQEVNVTLPTFDITMNDLKIENEYREYPFIVYKDITYFPMTWMDSRLFGLETNWDGNTGLEVTYTGKLGSYRNYKPDFQTSKNAKYLKASIPTFNVNVKVNGKEIDNSKEPYPILHFRNIAYFPLTWRFTVDEFNWGGYRFTHKEGLNIETVEGYGEPTLNAEKISAIKRGELTISDIEKLLGRKLVYIGVPDAPNLYEPRGGGFLLLVRDHSVVYGIVGH